MLAVGFLALPLVGLLWRIPWSEAAARVRSPELWDALRLSLWTSVTAAAVAMALGLPLAWILARVPGRGRNLLRAVASLPLVLPPVVGGVALLAALGRRGLVGQWLDAALGISLPFTAAAVVVAQAFVALPFVVLTAEAAFRSADVEVEEAARTLGAGPVHTFLRVTVPLARPGLVAGAVLAWARALGEFGATITFAGNFPGRTQTVPLQVYLLLETEPGGAFVLAGVLLGVSLAVLVAMRGRWLGARS